MSASLYRAAQLFYDAVMRNALADHWSESYVSKTGKSMKAGELAAPRKDRWRKIAEQGF
jgi:hypothetical protein